MVYKISFSRNGRGAYRLFTAESEGEALEQFDDFCDMLDDDIEFISIVEVRCE